MILLPKRALEELRNVINEKSEYRSGSKLVNVSQMTEGQASGGLGIKVAGILSVGNIEAGKSDQETHTASNRLSFTIPLSIALVCGKPREEN